MKKYESLFTKEYDKIIFPLLIRSMKDTGYKPKIKIKEIIECCIHSRKNHFGEAYFQNISFWPKDIGIIKSSFSALFLARVINLDIFETDDALSSSIVRNFSGYLMDFDCYYKSLLPEILAAMRKILTIKNDKIETELLIGNKWKEYSGIILGKEKIITPYSYETVCSKK